MAITSGNTARERTEPADHCQTPSCWNTDDLQVVEPETNAAPVTLCRRCRKRFWGVSL